MFADLPSPAEMSRWDRAAIDMGIPEPLLMENAAREALHVLLQVMAHKASAYTHARTSPATLHDARVLLFMGSGNNGGDAACLARHLHDAGADVLVLHTRPLRACKGTHIRLARQCGVPFAPASGWPARYRDTRWDPLWCPEETDATSSPLPLRAGGPDIVVDGLLGTGFSGTLRAEERRLVARINAFSGQTAPLCHRTFILALDIPSGLNGMTGRPCPVAVRAHATVSFEAAKPGLLLPEAAPFVGQLHVRPIGIPRVIREQYPASYRLIDREAAALLPVPALHWHKGIAGSVLIIGGTIGGTGNGTGETLSSHDSPLRDGGLTGAPHLAARAALRSGAGLVSVAAPSALCAAIKADCPDIMTRPLGAPGTTHWSPALLAELLPFLQRCDAVVIGPGIGREQDTIAFVLAFLALPNRPATVIDADALHALATAPHLLRHLTPTDILTPHPGEAAAILEQVNVEISQFQRCHSENTLGKNTAQVQADRFAALDALTKLSPAVWILKGAGTLVGSPNCPVFISPHAVPTLAVGGSGDVLAGCIGTLLAQLPKQARQLEKPLSETHLAACLGVLVHTEAGRLLASTFPMRGNTASDIADALPQARAELRANER